MPASSTLASSTLTSENAHAAAARTSLYGTSASPGVGADRRCAQRRRQVSPSLSRTEPLIVLISVVQVPGHAGGGLQGWHSPVPVVIAAIRLLYIYCTGGSVHLWFEYTEVITRN